MILNVSAASWNEALRALQTFLPNAENLGLDAIDNTIEKHGFKLRWNRLSDWEGLDDLVIFQRAFGQDILNQSQEGILVPWLCFWGKHLPFLVKKDCLEMFLDSFLVQNGESFFNGDTVLIFPSIQTLCMFGHNGAYTYYKNHMIS